MILREIVFVLVIVLFAAVALILVADLVHTEKNLDKHSKKNRTNTSKKTKTKKSYYQ